MAHSVTREQMENTTRDVVRITVGALSSGIGTTSASSVNVNMIVHDLAAATPIPSSTDQHHSHHPSDPSLCNSRSACLSSLGSSTDSIIPTSLVDRLPPMEWQPQNSSTASTFHSTATATATATAKPNRLVHPGDDLLAEAHRISKAAIPTHAPLLSTESAISSRTPLFAFPTLHSTSLAANDLPRMLSSSSGDLPQLPSERLYPSLLSLAAGVAQLPTSTAATAAVNSTISSEASVVARPSIWTLLANRTVNLASMPLPLTVVPLYPAPAPRHAV